MSLEGAEPGRAEPARQDGAPPPLRDITDARTLRALAHPVRIALLEALGLGGAMTATEVGEQIGESPTTCSFHLRQLAKYGFVEEAGGGRGRARPWRVTTIAMRVANTHDDPETELAANALGRLIGERQIDRHRTWVETRAAYPSRWRHAAEDSHLTFYLTADELEQLNDEVLALLRARFPERRTDPSLRPPGSVPVQMLVFSYPLMPPPADDGDTDDHHDR
jgi:DNA-binding transcriptional ArsR family regulator